MRIARFLVTPELLRQLLRLPVTSEIVWAGMDAGGIELTIRDPALQDVTLREGERPPFICPLMHEIHVDLQADDLEPLELALLGRFPSMVIMDWRQP